MSFNFFQEQHILEQASLVGYAALMKSLRLENAAPLRMPACISDHFIKGGTRLEGGWKLFDKRYRTEGALGSHLSFALRHESIDLLILKKIFQTIDKSLLSEYVRKGKGGTTSRRAWFFYEILTGDYLNVEDTAATVSIVDALDRKSYFTRLNSTLSRRHRVRNNLLGNAEFCPVIRRTKVLEDFISCNYSAKAKEFVERVDAELIARAASFLLLADTKASFAIEGETPSQNRIERWCRAVQESGKHKLTLAELERLQHILISDERFTTPGIRKKMVFLGRSSRMSDGVPLPEFIPARSEDLDQLINALSAVNTVLSDEKTGLDPVLHAAAIAFGFVYIHPFEDGNGRIHRCLIHSILQQRGFTPPQIIFPVSSVMAKRMTDYSNVLKSHSGPLMPFVKWKPVSSGIQVTNDTADLYKFFDCTEEAEFLYESVAKTVNEDVPLEIDYLNRHDKAMKEIMNTVEMPDAVAEKFIMFARQNSWKLPGSRREKEFVELTDLEVKTLESIVQEAFLGLPDQGILKRTN